MKSKFVKEKSYSREEIADKIGLPHDKRSGNWLTGYSAWDGEFFVFCNVGSAGRTGHDYPNSWSGSELVWFGKGPSHRDQPQIKRLTDGSVAAHVFWRDSDRSPFKYAGVGVAKDVSDTVPVCVRWAFR